MFVVRSSYILRLSPVSVQTQLLIADKQVSQISDYSVHNDKHSHFAATNDAANGRNKRKDEPLSVS